MTRTPPEAQTDNVTRKECIDLLRGTRSVPVASVSIDNAAPIRLVCFPLPDGTVLIPTGPDRSLVSAAADHHVTIQFEQVDPATQRGWVVRGTGVARPSGRRDRPPAATDTATALAMLYAFENGLRVDLDDLAGWRFTNA